MTSLLLIKRKSQCTPINALHIYEKNIKIALLNNPKNYISNKNSESIKNFTFEIISTSRITDFSPTNQSLVVDLTRHLIEHNFEHKMIRTQIIGLCS